MKKHFLLAAMLGTSIGIQAQHIPSTIDSVYAPIKVGVPPSDAYIGLSRLETGEIRHYNFGEQALPGNFYLSSKDNGLTWKRVNTPVGMPFADRQSPVSKEYIRVTHMPGMGVYCIRTVGLYDRQQHLCRWRLDGLVKTKIAHGFPFLWEPMGDLKTSEIYAWL